MTTSPVPTPEDVPGNRYRCNCGWSHTVRDLDTDADGCHEDTETILLHIRTEHPEISAAARESARSEEMRPVRTVTEEEDPVGYLTTVMRYRAARFAAFDAKAKDARRSLRDVVVEAVGLGMSELEASKLAGVTRQTVRSWVGK